MKPLPLAASLLLVALAPARAAEPATPPVLLVNVTSQAHDFIRPWVKRAPATRNAVGTVLAGKRVLVTGELVANHTFVELEKPVSAAKCPARVVRVDYDANLALLEPADASFLDGIPALAMSPDLKLGERAEAWQFEANGKLLVTEALLTTVSVAPYPADGAALLQFQLTCALQNREGSFTLPLVRQGKLAGVVMRYDPRNQNLQAIPGRIVARFLKAAAAPSYGGFPRAGLLFAGTRDPQFRRYIGLPEGNGGVYVTDVVKGGPGDKAGLKPGDVVLSVAGRTIDQEGHYADPLYGKIALANLINAEHFSGDKVAFKILRDGKPLEIDVTVERREPEDSVSPPYVIDRAPDYLIAGGLVFQELSRQYLKDLGNNWEKRAAQRLVYYDRYQGTLFPEGNRRIVFLSGVIPVPGTLGYNDLGGLVVTKVNGRDILSLKDLAAALESPADGFHRIEFEDDPKTIFLDPATMPRDEAILREQYGIPALRRLP